MPEVTIPMIVTSLATRSLQPNQCIDATNRNSTIPYFCRRARVAPHYRKTEAFKRCQLPLSFLLLFIGTTLRRVLSQMNSRALEDTQLEALTFRVSASFGLSKFIYLQQQSIIYTSRLELFIKNKECLALCFYFQRII